MISQEELLNKINNITCDKDFTLIVRKYLLHGIPYIFNSNQDLYYDFRNSIAEHFHIDYRNVYIVGSAKLGYSYYKGTKFSLESDIDVAMVDRNLFNQFHQNICEFQYKIDQGYITNTSNEIKSYHCFLEYLSKGWLRPDKLPAKDQIIAIKDDWFDFFKSISYGKGNVGNYKVAGGLYESYFFLEKYYIESFKSIKSIK